ncbi:hypothetical protein [Streptomyces chattanoogensis]|uniref:hypothetical protein n=1 Tax=Streptomyces chattanoogensis TaxID=66876 RepID=UPI0036A829CE
MATKAADPQAQRKNEALAAYKAFWAEQARAYGKADLKGTRLEKLASGEALTRAMTDVATMKQAGTVTKGAPAHDAKVTSIRMRGKLPTATISDCLDISRWKTVKARSGKVVPFPKNQPLRYITSAYAEKWSGGWMILKIAPQGNRPC